MARPNHLSGPQRQHLLANCQYADKLLSDIEEILRASLSKSAFPRYDGAIAPAQVRVVEDYIARIRRQIVNALESQGIEVPPPAFGTIHAVRVTLMFATIAFEECTADKMRGYGQVPPEAVADLNGLVSEIKAMIDQLSGYLAQRLDQDPAERLRRLEQTGDEVELLKRLGGVIDRFGLVDFRSRLAAILDRLESKSFEIALFGRVSSGKSSLLNHIVGTEILPVGVNPITAVPTRIVFGPEPRILVRAAGQNRQAMAIERVGEFVTEQQNPGNRKRVDQLVVEYPSTKLKDGVMFVDTPGLGSLASAGAAETLAYLPRCDLGVVLIDAGSTLTVEDLATLQALNEAAIQTTVVLSKADLIASEDVARSKEYIRQQILSHLRLDLKIHAVSVEPGFTQLLDDWFEHELAPLYQQHQQLTRDSLRRKIGALRDSVSGILRARLDRALHQGGPPVQSLSGSNEAEIRLRRVAAQFEEIRDQLYRQILEIRGYGSIFLHDAAGRIADTWRNQKSNLSVTWESLTDLATVLAAERAVPVRTILENLAKDLSACIQEISQLLGEESASATGDLASVVKEMPRIDLGSGKLHLERPWTIAISPWLVRRKVRSVLEESAGGQIRESFSTFASMLDSWSKRIAGELQLRFNSYADAHRAKLARGSAGGNREDAASLREALEDLTIPAPVETK